MQIMIDAKAFHAAIEKGERETLIAIGESIDTAATANLVTRSRRSRPGESPTSHATGSRSLRNIQSAYDPATRSVVIGSVLLSGSLASASGGPLPSRLEFGTSRIAARPNMQPTLDRANSRGTLRNAWTGSMGGR